MRLGLRKILAILTVCLTALGTILSLFLLIQVWHYRQPVTEKLQSSVDQVSVMLQTTDDGLVVINQVVENVYTSTIYLNDATNALSQTVQSTSLFMNSAGSFVGDNLVTTITNTQTALGSAQASAKVIDNILTTMSHIPLIGIAYDPSVPLNIALGNVSTSLDPLQTKLKYFQSSLEGTSTNMQTLSGQISDLNKNIINIQENLTQAKVTIDKYRSQINSLKSWIMDVKENLASMITIIAWIMTVIILWLMILQIIIMLQAIIGITSNFRG